MPQAKIPPHSLETEQSVIGAILIDKNAIVEVASFLRPGHFYDDRHQAIFSAILVLYEEHKPIDLLTLIEKLKALKKYKDIGGSAYLTELTGVVPTSAHVEEYARMVHELHAKRELITASAEIAEMSFDTAKNLKEVLDRAESKIFSISQENLSRNVVSMKDILTQSFDRLDEIQKTGGGMRGLPSGFRDLDNILAGFQASNLIVVAARPGIGKSAFLLNVAQHIAVKEKKPLLIFSLEMSQEEVCDRLLVIQAGIDSWKLKTGRLADEDFDALQEAMGVLAEAPIYLDDTPGLSVMEMRTKARREQLENGISLIFVDYLQLMDSGRHFDNRVQEVSIISQALKNLARELRVPVIAASQLNRAVEQRGSKKPQLADLRESGCLSGQTQIMRADTGERVTIKELIGKGPLPVFALDHDLMLRVHRMVKVFSSGVKKVFRLELKSGNSLHASANHPFRTLYGWERLDELVAGTRLAVAKKIPAYVDPVDPPEERLVLLAHTVGDGCYLSGQPMHHTRGNWRNTQNNFLKNLAVSDIFWDEVVKIVPQGEENVFDATVEGAHNFLANDIVVHNSIEQDSDVVMFLYRPEESKDLASTEKIPTKLSIDKHRNGQAGVEIDFMFHGPKMQFKLVAKQA